MDAKDKIDKVYAFLFLPPGEPDPENVIVYAVAQSKAEKDEFIRERGCHNMTVVKLDNQSDLCAFGEYLGYPSEIPFLFPYKVGLGKHGEELTMLMTGIEHDEVVRMMHAMKNDVVRSSVLNGVFFKKKYKKALSIITEWPLSTLKIVVSLFGETFTIDEKGDDKP